MSRPGSDDASDTQCPCLQTENAGSAALDDGAHMQTQVAGQFLCERNLKRAVGRVSRQSPLHNSGMLCCLSRIIPIKNKPICPLAALGHIESCVLHNRREA